ncbi:hypothetical protein SGLAM104S_09536 [Streptomyces glaucescens]
MTSRVISAFAAEEERRVLNVLKPVLAAGTLATATTPTSPTTPGRPTTPTPRWLSCWTAATGATTGCT